MGPAGRMGRGGRMGPAGRMGRVGPDGAGGAGGADGADGACGADGADGACGADGADGADGAAPGAERTAAPVLEGSPSTTGAGPARPGGQAYNPGGTTAMVWPPTEGKSWLCTCWPCPDCLAEASKALTAWSMVRAAAATESC